MRARVASVLACMCAAGLTAKAQTAFYSITDLGRLPNAFSTVPLAINNHGEVVGWCQGPQAFTRAFVWRPGQGISELPMPAGRDYNVARDISDSGFIVGHAKTGILGAEHAWRWHNDTLQDLGSLEPGGFSEAWGVNEMGDTVGRSEGSGFLGNAFSFSDDTGMLDLQAGAAQAINSAGEVAGYTSNNQAFRWTQSGGREILGTLGTYVLTFGYTINEDGQVGGEATTASGNGGIAFIHTSGLGYETLPSLGRFDQVAGLNNLGEAVGFSGNTRGVSTTEWLWRPGAGSLNLSTLIDQRQATSSPACSTSMTPARSSCSRRRRRSPVAR